MTDRELLELAARAQGYKPHGWDADINRLLVEDEEGPGLPWNPLRDDGDALRLAARLGINLEIGEPGFGDVQAGKHDHWAVEWLSPDDPCAATRRAIVRAAAEIGKAMPDV